MYAIYYAVCIRNMSLWERAVNDIEPEREKLQRTSENRHLRSFIFFSIWLMVK